MNMYMYMYMCMCTFRQHVHVCNDILMHVFLYISTLQVNKKLGDLKCTCMHYNTRIALKCTEARLRHRHAITIFLPLNKVKVNGKGFLSWPLFS